MREHQFPSRCQHMQMWNKMVTPMGWREIQARSLTCEKWHGIHATGGFCSWPPSRNLPSLSWNPLRDRAKSLDSLLLSCVKSSSWMLWNYKWKSWKSPLKTALPGSMLVSLTKLTHTKLEDQPSTKVYWRLPVAASLGLWQFISLCLKTSPIEPTRGRRNISS